MPVWVKHPSLVRAILIRFRGTLNRNLALSAEIQIVK